VCVEHHDLEIAAVGLIVMSGDQRGLILRHQRIGIEMTMLLLHVQLFLRKLEPLLPFPEGVLIITLQGI